MPVSFLLSERWMLLEKIKFILKECVIPLFFDKKTSLTSFKTYILQCEIINSRVSVSPKDQMFTGPHCWPPNATQHTEWCPLVQSEFAPTTCPTTSAQETCKSQTVKHPQSLTQSVLGKSSKKKRISYGQADRKGWGSAPLTLTISKCENVDPFFPLKFDSLILNTQFISLWGVSIMHCSCP